ncbi:hypothetical protein BGZ67_006235 [Mortierella alpina]|nr:hypothetical protein BGZ67_006235 [Mortierella alpina]
MDSSSALEEEALAIVSIYGPSSFYPISTRTPNTQSTPAYTLRVSLEEPDFDYDPTTAAAVQDNTQIHSRSKNAQSSKNIKELELAVYFPQGYPETNTTAPVHEIVSIYYGTLRLTDDMVREIDQGLEECFVPGEVIVFSWIEWLRTYLEEVEQRLQDDRTFLEGPQDQNEDDAEDEEGEEEDGDDDDDDDDSAEEEESQKSATDYFKADDSSQDPTALSSSLASLSLHHHHPTPTPFDSNSPRISGQPMLNIRSGQPIVDRKSVFIAHLADITQPGQVPWMIQQLKQENKKVIKATHNIMAFRVENENGTIAQDNDDDGETAAGSRLLHLMSILDVKNVVVVVSRWYGGIPLSADRFKHINNAARQLLDECGFIQQAPSAEAASSAGGKKKGKSKKTGKR